MELVYTYMYLYLGEQCKNLFVYVQRKVLQHNSIN